MVVFLSICILIIFLPFCSVFSLLILSVAGHDDDDDNDNTVENNINDKKVNNRESGDALWEEIDKMEREREERELEEKRKEEGKRKREQLARLLAKKEEEKCVFSPLFLSFSLCFLFFLSPSLSFSLFLSLSSLLSLYLSLTQTRFLVSFSLSLSILCLSHFFCFFNVKKEERRSRTKNGRTRNSEEKEGERGASKEGGEGEREKG